MVALFFVQNCLNLNYLLTSNYTNEDHDDCDDEEDMDEASHSVRGNHAQKPQNQEDNCNCCKHVCLLIIIYAHIERRSLR